MIDSYSQASLGCPVVDGRAQNWAPEGLSLNPDFNTHSVKSFVCAA